MTAVHQIFTVRSFRSAKDRDFLKALQIYDEFTHPQEKTDSIEIAHWLDCGANHPGGRFYVCGLFISGEIVGFVEFIYLKKERVIHFDYFIVRPERRSAGAFHIFAEQMRAFFVEEKLEWDFITAEIAELEVLNGLSRHAQRLIRLFRQVGFCQVLVDYEQPLLGVNNSDTAIRATLMLLPRVDMETISRSRFLELVAAIYRKHYVEWYSIYSKSTGQYQVHIDKLLAQLEKRIEGKTGIQLKGPEREFPEPPIANVPPLREAMFYVLKIAAGGCAVAVFNVLLRHKMEYSAAWVFGITTSVFLLLVVTISLADKKRFEAFKLLVSLVSKFFDR